MERFWQKGVFKLLGRSEGSGQVVVRPVRKDSKLLHAQVRVVRSSALHFLWQFINSITDNFCLLLNSGVAVGE